MKFTAFVLATAAATASAQIGGFNPFLNVPNQFGGVAYQPYPVQQAGAFNPYPVQQPLYPVPAPVAQDPLAWERDCTWVNAIDFRNKLSLATCGQTNCASGPNGVSQTPNGNGGGSDRKHELYPTQGLATSPDGDQYHVWGSVINRAGRVCAVAYTGKFLDSQFPFGRIQSMKRANTANSLSLPSRAMPSHVADRHNFIDSVEDGNPGDADNGWYGFSHDRFNPGNVDVQHQGATASYGEACGSERQDPMCMQKPGGMDYSAGGLALYDTNGFIRGAIGVAGDNDCTSHAIAWKTRIQLNLHYTPVNKQRPTFNDNQVCVAVAAAATTPNQRVSQLPRQIVTAQDAQHWTRSAGSNTGNPQDHWDAGAYYAPAIRHLDVGNSVVATALGNLHNTAADNFERTSAQGTITNVAQSLGTFNNLRPPNANAEPLIGLGNAVGNALLGGAAGGRFTVHTGWDLWGDSIDVKCNSHANNNEQLTNAVVALKWPPQLPTAQTTNINRATWAHTGAKAEDNVVFNTREWRNFPACYYLIRRFQIDNPTKGAGK